MSDREEAALLLSTINSGNGIRAAGRALVAAAAIAEMAMGEQDWRAEADRRIEAVRKGDFALDMVGVAGEKLSNAVVSVRQTRSHFLFGTCVTGDPLSTDEDEKAYFRFIRETFNALVCENAMKWYATEKQAGVLTCDDADRLMAFAETNGIAMRGHCLFWSKQKFVQPWVQALDPAALRSAMEARLNQIVGRYRGRLAAWDVNNELLDGAFFSEKLGPDIDAWMFHRASELDPAVQLFVNEYGVLCNEDKLGRYIALIKRLQDAGAKVGGIGIQEHAVERFAATNEVAKAEADRPERAGRGPLVPADVWRRLDRLADFGLPIHVTEVSSKTADQQRRADSLEMLFRVGFAHPRVEAIMLWGFWEKRHWLGGDAALVDARWNLLPAGERVRRLLLEEWRTRAEGRSDGAGRFRFRGFHGDYEVEAVTADGTRLRGTARLPPTAARVEAQLSVESGHQARP
jgi:endo-1,4-beta-xylanase